MKKETIEAIRSFNRFYTSIIGLLDKHILNSNYTLAESRIMYELYYGKNQTASDLIGKLSIDKGYLSRVLRQFEKQRLLVRQHSPDDTRSVFLNLSTQGKKEFERLEKASNDQVSMILKGIPENDIALLLTSMDDIKRVLTRK